MSPCVTVRGLIPRETQCHAEAAQGGTDPAPVIRTISCLSGPGDLAIAWRDRLDRERNPLACQDQSVAFDLDPVKKTEIAHAEK